MRQEHNDPAIPQGKEIRFMQRLSRVPKLLSPAPEGTNSDPRQGMSGLFLADCKGYNKGKETLGHLHKYGLQAQ